MSRKMLLLCMCNMGSTGGNTLVSGTFIRKQELKMNIQSEMQTVLKQKARQVHRVSHKQEQRGSCNS